MAGLTFARVDSAHLSTATTTPSDLASSTTPPKTWTLGRPSYATATWPLPPSRCMEEVALIAPITAGLSTTFRATSRAAPISPISRDVAHFRRLISQIAFCDLTTSRKLATSRHISIKKDLF